MPFCTNCGKKISDDVQTCPFCGRPVNFEGANQNAQQNFKQNNQQNFSQNPVQNPNQGYQQNNAQGNAQNYQQTNYQQPNYQQQNNAQSSFNSADALNTQDYTSQFDPKDVAANKIYAVFAYFGILFLVPLLAAKDSPFAKFHTNQGIVIFICECIVSMIVSVMSHFPVVGVLFSILGGLCSLVLFVAVIMGIVYAAQGQAKELPVIGKIKILK